MPDYTTEGLAAEIFSEMLRRNGEGFTLIREVGTVTGQHGTEALVENAAVFRELADRFPDLKITYPQTVLSEADAHTRTNAVIQVPEPFSAHHCGTAFQQIMHDKWQPQLDELTAEITRRLRKHEFKTARLFSANPLAGSASFRVTDETAESDIWAILLESCGLYPLQWDDEITGMALLLCDALKTALAEDGREILEVAAERNPAEKCCTVTVYYSIKQD
ncbi:MAG: hypothetical protein IKX57_00955 [Oscillospiraceae bacterium]|nr:hypothetical protein [Oscillospiraceae bacterium]